MDRTGWARYEARAKIIKALAHPARLLIVDELAGRGEQCVCALTDLVGTDMSTVSRHLAQLREAGLVEDEKRGQKVFYRLRAGCLDRFFRCIELVLRSGLDPEADSAGGQTVERAVGQRFAQPGLACGEGEAPAEPGWGSGPAGTSPSPADR